MSPDVRCAAFVCMVCACQVPQMEEDVGPPPPDTRTESCTIIRVADGDSVDCEPLGRIRLIGIDAPELNQPPYGEQSAVALRRLIPTGTDVRVEVGIEPTDQFGRLLGHLWLDELLVNWWMVRNGWAVLITYPPNVRYVDWLTAALREAQAQELGLWAVAGFECLPVQRRREQC